MSDKMQPVEIKILGKDYRIACTARERNDLLESARRLDQKMREVRDTGRVVGQERIAVMAALNLTHELTLSQKENGFIPADLNVRLIELQEKIDGVLESDEFDQ